jgi:uncharacterized protein
MTTRVMVVWSLILAVLAGAYTAAVYGKLPQQIPIHWDFQGNVNGWADKGTAVWLISGVIAALLLFGALADFLSPKTFKVAPFRATFNYFVFLTVALMLFMHVMTLQTALHPGLELSRYLIAGVMAFMALIGNLLGKVRKNFWVGIRSPWTLASDRVWIATHRLAGRLMFGGGMALAVLALLGVPELVLPLGLLVILLIPFVYSFVLYRRLEGGGNGAAAVLILAVLILSAVDARAAEREVSFKGFGGFELKGTLALPDGTLSAKLPAVVMLAGSGPTDRNGNQMQAGVHTDLLKQFAEALAKQGFASLRFDKRAVPGTYMNTWPKDMSKINDFFSWEAFVADGKAAVEFLRAQPEVDAKRVAVLGHSEGTMVGLSVAKELAGEQRPAALILVAGPGRRTVDVLREQLEAGLRAGRIKTADGKKMMADYASTSSQLIEHGTLPASINPELAPLFPRYATRFIRSMLGFDPPSVAAAYAGPVLVMQGASDLQISAERDTPLLVKALRARAAGTTDVEIVPSASHCLKAVKNASDPGFPGPVVPSALEKLVAWIKAKL